MVNSMAFGIHSFCMRPWVAGFWVRDTSFMTAMDGIWRSSLLLLSNLVGYEYDTMGCSE